MNQDHLKKKPNKKEMQDKVIDTFQKQLKDNYVKSLVQGGEIIAQTILNFINDGKDLEYIKCYCESLVKAVNDGTMEKVTNK